MRKINLKHNQNKGMMILVGTVVVATGLFMSSRFLLPDDTPIKDTWQTSSYSRMGYRISVGDVTTSKETGETFFTLVHEGKSTTDENIKLSLHAMNDDNSLSAIQNVSQLTIESEEKQNLKMTGYSFFWPNNTYHLQVTVTSLDEENHLLNQQVIYLDKRKVTMSEEAFTMSDYVTKQLTAHMTPNIETSTNKVENPTATTESTVNKSPEEITGDDIQTPNDELQNPTGTLQQSYVIDENEQIQSNHGHDHEIVETDQPQYTLADLEHQLARAQEELQANPDDEAIKQRIIELEHQIQEMKGMNAGE